ncbi:MAG: GGDEF domain-containing protein [Clostridia bacterium]|nr:GGDEF domain-containing protein [Clostridia bacterium]
MSPESANASKISKADRLLLDYLFDLLIKNAPPPEPALPNSLKNDPKYKELLTQIMDIRALSASLRNGELEHTVASRGFVLSNIKTVQTNMRQLAWQAKQITEGDYPQKVEFLGEFSETFSEMTQRLLDTTAQLISLANVDTLTKVANRLAMNRFLAFAFAEAQSNDADLCVLMLDIDHFKEVNDTFGHSAGDQVLVEVAQRIQSQTRQTDFLARYGGEEFVVVLPETSMEIAHRVCDRILKCVRATPVICDDGVNISVTISIGVSRLQPEDKDSAQILSRSDVALYEAKRTGRDRWCEYKPELSM